MLTKRTRNAITVHYIPATNSGTNVRILGALHYAGFTICEPSAVADNISALEEADHVVAVTPWTRPSYLEARLAAALGKSVVILTNGNAARLSFGNVKLVGSIEDLVAALSRGAQSIPDFIPRSELPPPSVPPIFDFVDFLRRQQEFSETTFGAGRVQGVIDHLIKEVAEVAANPDDLSEWIDAIILAADGAMRSGFTPEQIAAGLEDKLAVNRGREWSKPDNPESQAIEHVRGNGQ